MRFMTLNGRRLVNRAGVVKSLSAIIRAFEANKAAVGIRQVAHLEERR